MKANYCNQHQKWRLIIPSSMTGTGKRKMRFFDTKEEAEAEAQQLEEEHSAPADDLTSEDIAFARFCKKEFGGSHAQACDAAKLYKKINDIPAEKKVTLEKACVDFVERQRHEQKNRRTIYSDKTALKKLSIALGRETPLVEVTQAMLDDHIAQMPPGTTRRGYYARIKKFINWAWRSHYLAVNPWEKSKPLDKWGSNTERVKIEHYRRILFCVAGLEPFKEGEAPTNRYVRLLPLYVLGGMCGMRRCELIDCNAMHAVLEWSHILWDENLVYVPHEVAKETQKQDRKRYIPLTPEAKAWLQLVRKDEGRILDFSQSTLQRLNDEFLDVLNDKMPRNQKVVVPDNGLRNSYASYRASFDSPGAVARAMGDLESTIMRFYVGEALKPETGRAWFAITPPPEAKKIIPMRAAA
jgi:integrase